MPFKFFSRYLFSVLFIFLSISVLSQDSSFVIPLWQNGAPGFENKKNEPEQAKDWWVKHIIKSWPQRLTDWLVDNNWLKKK